MSEEQQTKKRAGETEIKSVSVSKHFNKLIDQYNISPTDAFRKGIAVTLFDLGIIEYQSDKNKDRFNFVNKYMNYLDSQQKEKELFEKINDFNLIKKSIPLMAEIVKLFNSPTIVKKEDEKLHTEQAQPFTK